MNSAKRQASTIQMNRKNSIPDWGRNRREFEPIMVNRVIFVDGRTVTSYEDQPT
jgi:hypothetical protein